MFYNTIIKSITYRIYSSIITFLISWLITRNLIVSFSIGVFDSLIKIASYYYFDKIWAKLTGIKQKPCVLWLTGLSGAGKTTIANGLIDVLKKYDIVPVLLDGDEIRNAIKLTGFDEESRKKHNLNVGLIASIFERQGNVVIVSLISPYEDVRNEVRDMCNKFVEIYISTDINLCIDRDPKGLYKKAIAGEIKDFTGISAPYYPPASAEITIDTKDESINDCVNKILKYYKNEI